MHAALLPILVVLAVAPRGGVATGPGRTQEAFATASIAPHDVEFYLHVRNGAAARSIIEARPMRAAFESMVGELAVGRAWREFVADLSMATESGQPLDDGGVFDTLFGADLTLLVRRDAAGLRSGPASVGREAALEWAIVSRVDVDGARAMLERLSPRLSIGGWRTLVGHDLSYAFVGDAMVMAPANRRGLAESTMALRLSGGQRLAGLEALQAARELGQRTDGAEDAAHVEVFVRHPGDGPAAAGWTAAVVNIGRDGRVGLRHRTSFDAPQFSEVPRRAFDLAALRSLANRASMAVIQPISLEAGGAEGFVAAAPDVVATFDGGPTWNDILFDGLLRLQEARSSPSSPWLSASGAPRGALERSFTHGASSERRWNPPVRSILAMPALLVSMRPAAEEFEVGAQASSPTGGSRRSGADGAAPGCAIVFEIGRGEASVPDQQAQVAERARRRLSVVEESGPVLPGDYPASIAPAGSGRRRGVAGDGLVTRVVRTRAGDFQIVGEDPRFVEDLAQRLAEAKTSTSHVSVPLRSAGFMDGAALADEVSALLGGVGGDGVARLAAGLEAIEWCIAQPDSRTVGVEASARLRSVKGTR